MAVPQAERPNAKTPWWRRVWRLGGARRDVGDEVVFPAGFLESLERLRLAALRATGSGLREGHRLGAYRGGQLEFHDHRAYVPGDDLRYLDWNLYARMGKPFIKEFAREEAGSIYILLDGTPSMGLGQPSKWTLARQLTALLAHVSWSSHDSVRIFVFRTGSLELESFPPPGSRGGIKTCLGWLRELSLDEGLSRTPDEPGTRSAAAVGGVIRAAADSLLRQRLPRGRIFIISDFWEDERVLAEPIRRLSAAGYDLAGIHVLAQEEATIPESGELRVRSLEDDGDVELSVSGAAKEQFEKELDDHLAAVKSLFRKRGGLYLYERSNVPLERVLIQALRQRRWVV